MKKFPPNRANQIAPDDAALFRATIGEVKPLAEQNRIKPQNRPRKSLLRPPAPPAAIADTLSDGYPSKSVSNFGTEDAPSEFLRNGLSRMALRKLQRGNWPVQDNLDLHGNNSDAARKLLQEFLHEAVQRKVRCVLVIHGKGINSKDGKAVLRKLARHWLTQHPHVMGYCDALPKQGGSGAVLVLLKNNS
ncbi:MAG: Smr/MutS family protein [Gallionella sp.]